MFLASWPLTDLRVRTQRLELRLIREEEFDQLVELARAIPGAPGVFAGPWAALPDPEFSRSVVQYQWSTRANWSVDGWDLIFGVYVFQPESGEFALAGVQDIGGKRFAKLRQVATGSWLGERFVRQGIGTEMRAAVLAFAFDHLNAEVALSSARDSNQGSRGVSRRLGYRENGATPFLFGDDTVADDIGLRLDANEWRSNPAVRQVRDAIGPIEVTGFEACRDMFGVLLAQTSNASMS